MLRKPAFLNRFVPGFITNGPEVLLQEGWGKLTSITQPAPDITVPMLRAGLTQRVFLVCVPSLLVRTKLFPAPWSGTLLPSEGVKDHWAKKRN